MAEKRKETKAVCPACGNTTAYIESESVLDVGNRKELRCSRCNHQWFVDDLKAEAADAKQVEAEREAEAAEAAAQEEAAAEASEAEAETPEADDAE